MIIYNSIKFTSKPFDLYVNFLHLQIKIQIFYYKLFDN